MQVETRKSFETKQRDQPLGAGARRAGVLGIEGFAMGRYYSNSEK